jgi:hypothetical protein
MSNSSVTPAYSITSSDTITIDTSTFANVGSSSSYYYTGNMGTITIGASISSLTTAQITGISAMDTSAFSFKMPTEWEDKFPDFDRIQKMCKEYPGLQIAFEKFKTTYLLVKNHYDTPEDQRPLP